MAIDTAGITALFQSMMTEYTSQLDAAYLANTIDAEVYAKAFSSALQPTMQLATTAIQQQALTDKQVLKMTADTAFVTTQDGELTNSVKFNNKIKALDSYSDMIGTMGAGSLTVSGDMWTSYFGMVQDVNNSVLTDLTINPADVLPVRL